jgi:cytosine/adenosine deaminase-related metal-dependent hydrolase
MTTVLSADWVLPIEGPPIEDGAVVIRDARIDAIGSAAELGQGERFENAAIVPGFVNAHSHLEYAVYAGFGDGFDFGPWIELHMDRKSRIGLDEMRAIARVGAAECLRSGITTVGDSSYSGAAAEACAELGLRAIVYVEVFGHDRGRLGHFNSVRERIHGSLSDRVRLGVGPHAPYSVSPDLYEACLELGLPVMTHLSESEAERDWLIRGAGPFERLADLYVSPPGESGPRLLARHGLLRPGVVAVHCVKVDREEIELLARHGVAVAHCPRSNALLGCGIAPVNELRAAGIRVGVGTDGVSSTPSLDMFDELRAAVALARVRAERSDALSAADALQLATLGSARALGLDGEIGSLVPGKRADLTVISLTDSPFLPWEEPEAAVVFGGSPERVLLTLVDGDERYRKGGTEWRGLIDAASHARSRLLRPAATRVPT